MALKEFEMLSGSFINGVIIMVMTRSTAVVLVLETALR